MAPQSNDFLILSQTDIPFKNRSEKKRPFPWYSMFLYVHMHDIVPRKITNLFRVSEQIIKLTPENHFKHVFYFL